MSSPTPSPDAAFELLANPKRRCVLAVLRDHGPLDERTLARRMLARRRDVPPDAVDADRIEEARIELWHVHLPQLDETALLDHDRSERRVAPGPALTSVAPLLEYAAERAADTEANA